MDVVAGWQRGTCTQKLIVRSFIARSLIARSLIVRSLIARSLIARSPPPPPTPACYCPQLPVGYTPNDYLSEVEWQARSLIESSDAVKCPSVAYQLAGRGLGEGLTLKPDREQLACRGGERKGG